LLQEYLAPWSIGVQNVAPESGDRCIVGFTDSNEKNPYIINFINDFANERQVNSSIANTGIPRYLI
jgi:hypothetical protein